jgi:hypothetical protein
MTEPADIAEAFRDVVVDIDRPASVDPLDMWIARLLLATAALQAVESRVVAWTRSQGPPASLRTALRRSAGRPRLQSRCRSGPRRSQAAE